VQSVNGPMARSLQDLQLYCKTVIAEEPWLYDPRCLPLSWRDVPVKDKLKIAVMWDDGVVKPTPPITRALKETVQKLQKAGHEIVDWNPVDHGDGLKILVRDRHTV